MGKQISLTPDGKIKLEEELRELKQVKMPEIISKIEQAKEMGDLSENAEYHDAKDQQGLYGARIAELEEILKNCLIVEKSEGSATIQMGTSFVVIDESGKERGLTVVGFNEADPVNGKISNVSPMGSAFLNKSIGQEVEVEAPRGIIKFKIVQIK